LPSDGARPAPISSMLMALARVIRRGSDYRRAACPRGSRFLAWARAHVIQACSESPLELLVATLPARSAAST